MSDSDSGGSNSSGGGGGTPLRDVGADALVDGSGGGAVNLECNLDEALDLVSDACGDCLVRNCSTDLEAAFGTTQIPTTVSGGACSTYLECLAACSCGDSTCLDQCLANAGTACALALDDVGDCRALSCDVACRGGADPLLCGNGTLDDGEQCDGAAIAGDCTDYGFGGGSLGCAEGCVVVTDGCFISFEGVCSEAEETLDVGVPINGALSQSSLRAGDEGYRVVVYRLSLETSQTVTITLVSSEFDAFLILSDGECQMLDDDDDSGPGSTDSQIVYTATESGDVFVIATSYGATEAGEFTLSAE